MHKTKKHSEIIKSDIKIEISNQGMKLKPEIKKTLQDAQTRGRFLLEMGYQIKLFKQNQTGQWTPLKNQKIHNTALPKL